jgi:hypothetical protein
MVKKASKSAKSKLATKSKTAVKSKTAKKTTKSKGDTIFGNELRSAARASAAKRLNKKRSGL